MSVEETKSLKLRDPYITSPVPNSRSPSPRTTIPYTLNNAKMAHLNSYLQQLEKDFTIDTAKLKYVTDHFVKELEKGMTRDMNRSKFHR
jgi:hypothetical protein